MFMYFAHGARAERTSSDLRSYFGENRNFTYRVSREKEKQTSSNYVAFYVRMSLNDNMLLVAMIAIHNNMKNKLPQESHNRENIHTLNIFAFSVVFVSHPHCPQFLHSLSRFALLTFSSNQQNTKQSKRIPTTINKLQATNTKTMNECLCAREREREKTNRYFRKMIVVFSFWKTSKDMQRVCVWGKELHDCLNIPYKYGFIVHCVNTQQRRQQTSK